VESRQSRPCRFSPYTLATKSTVLATESTELVTMSTATSCRIQAVAESSPKPAMKSTVSHGVGNKVDHVSNKVDCISDSRLCCRFVASVYWALKGSDVPLGRFGSGPCLLDQMGSGVRVSVSFQKIACRVLSYGSKRGVMTCRRFVQQENDFNLLLWWTV